MEQIQHFINGIASGWTKTLIMQPFEKVKVMLQTQGAQKEYNGIIDCIKKVIKTEGFGGFYKGTLVPLLGLGTVDSIRFGGYENIKILLKQYSGVSGQLPLSYKAVSGFSAGCLSSILLCVIEHTRIRIQIQKTSNQKIYSGSLNAGIVIFRKYGFRGLFKGQILTTLRESTGLCFLFTIYEYITKLMTPVGTNKLDIPLYVPLMAGGIGGIAYWCFNYPLDYVKSLIQSDSFENPKYRGTIHCFREQAKLGYSIFFKGYLICMLRSFPVNAGGLVSYRLMQNLSNVKNVE